MEPVTLSHDDKINLTANVLRAAKALAPDRVMQPSPDTVSEWTAALSATYDALPVHIWPEAVRVWSNEIIGDRMITTGEIRRAAYIVRDRWDNDPAKRAILEERREALRIERDRQLADGTFMQVRGYRPREITKPQQLDQRIESKIESLKRNWAVSDDV